MRCVSVRVSAGLGNQLFQYTAGLALARRWNAALSLDTSWYRFSNYRPRRPFRLRELGLGGDDRSNLIGDSFLMVMDLLAKRGFHWEHFPLPGGIRVIVEDGEHERQKQLYGEVPRENFISLSGYWQTIDHFLSVKDELRRSIRPTFHKSAAAMRMLERIEAGDSGFIHVRRGDFLTLGHPVLPMDYYRHATLEIEKRLGHRLRWFVFSDDPDWCRNAMDFLQAPEFVSLPGDLADLEEFELMRSCRHGVIANSSFSWWAAALLQNTEGLVCAPRNRYGEHGGAELQRERLLPTWELID